MTNQLKKTTITIFSLILTTSALAGSNTPDSNQQSYFIERYDLNSDKNVTQEEFAVSRRQIFDTADENTNGIVNKEEYVYEYSSHIDKKIFKERKAQVKQTVIRFKSLDKDKNKKMTWEEYQLSGERSFKRYDTNEDLVINAQDKQPKNRWEVSPNSDSKKKKEKQVKKNKKAKNKYRKSWYVVKMPSTHNKSGMLEKYDSNNDNAITHSEFLAKRQLDFNRTDDNNDDWISMEEYIFEYENRLDSVIVKTRKAEVKQAYFQFNVLDKNKNGEMTFKEYQISGKKSFKTLDTNKDSVVSYDDPTFSKNIKKSNKNLYSNKG